MTVYEALKVVLTECKDEYAKTYAKAALELGECDHHFIRSNQKTGIVEIQHVPTGKPMVGHELKVQILYVLSNLDYWRGERAREVKKVLKEASK